MVGNNENILVEFDYNNITIIDPNKVIDSENNVKDRFVKHEELIMYANLECKLLPRTKLALGVSNDDRLQTISVASINFLKQGDKEKLDNSYTDEITGKDTLRGRGVNQIKQDKIQNPNISNDNYLRQTLHTNGKPGEVNNGLLGITSINIRQGLDFLPTIKMTLEDIKGRAMFEGGDNSLYAAFFNLPYPKFYLTIKGYYGKAVRLQLMLQNFSSRYDTSDGNFKIDLTFYTYKYTLLSEIQMTSLLAVPHMYKSRINIETNNNTNNQFSSVEGGIVEIGYQKIRELYSEYKSKGLISTDFPEITLLQLRNRLESFIKNALDTFTKQNLDPLTDLDSFRNNLINYRKEVYDAVAPKSWFNEYMDTKNYFVLNDEEKTKIYRYKREYNDPQARRDAEAKLNGFILKYNELLENNTTVGKNGEYTINNKKTKSNIPINISLKTIKITLDISKVDLKETYRQLKGVGNPTDIQLNEFKSELVRDKVFNSLEIFNSNGNNENVYDYFVFEGVKNFIGIINKIEKDLQVIRGDIENKISDALNELLKDKGDNGLGFEPTIRNVLAVVFANGEAFLRLMDDVHRNSWNVRNNNYRKAAIFNNDVANANPDNINSGQDETTPVYPWPQFIVATNETENDEKYVIEYPGNPKYTNITKGYLYDVWPEVEFVEEFIKGLTERANVPETPLNFNNELNQTKRISYNALEFPINNDVYFNKEKVKYFYEIFERLLVSANYNGFVRLNDKLESDTLTNIIANSENTNILDSLSNDNPFIIKDLKELNINSSNFLSILQHMSNEGVGESWQNLIRGIFNTNYLKNITTNGSFNFISNSTLNGQLTEPLSSSSDAEKFNKFITSTNTNTLVLTDTYPFTDLNWIKNNLEDGSEISNNQTVLNTSKTLRYNDSKKIISNFNNTTTTNQIRPITNFNFKVIETPRGYQTDLKTFYEFRDPFYQLPTEGNLNYSNYDGLVSSTQTVSILNTPYFINAIQEGVNKFKNKENNPFISAAYLFINSLPLSTLREKFKTYNDDNTQSDLDYIFATLKKFSGIHKVPYAWVLKIGSEWHRYKTFILSGNDILSNVWSDFNQINNFDPVTQSPNKEYQLEINGVNYDFGLENTSSSLNSQSQITTITNRINTGFYPKLIDDMSYFIKGESIFGDFTDNDIQNGIDNQLTLTYVNDAVINFSNFTFNTNSQTIRNINVTPWTVVLNDGSFSYLLPSNGSLINQTQNECIENNVSLKFEISNNQSMYNGSVRLFWAAPNYGYFDNGKVVKPTPEQHLKEIYSNKRNSFGIPFLGGLTPIPLNQQNFSINGNTTVYSDISEIFSVFSKDILDKFETEFLNFSKEAVDFTTTENEVLNEQTYQNFQLMVRELLKVPTSQLTTGEEFVTNIQNNQITVFSNLINNFLSYDIAFKFGNPSNFDRRLFSTFSSNPVIDSYSWGDYVIETPNALPTNLNNVTLFDSQNLYPTEWETLQLYVGFSNISGMTYSDEGSFITDFFIDNNISFTSQNIINLHPIIKIYATQKLINNSTNKTSFISLMDGYLSSTNILQNKILNNLMSILRLNLPTVTNVDGSTNKSETDGNQTKLELWETFKALNDKWIAGNDFKNKTLFEDVLLLDRASRDIGNKIFVDLFKLKNSLTNIGEYSKETMLIFIQGLLIENNFVVMNLPSYVNFYNVQEVSKDSIPRPEKVSDLANTLFGTFSNVDYRDSSAKLVCFYANKPSSVVDLKNNVDYRFRNDSFDFGRISGHPLIEDQTEKNDHATSNKVVGFNVDVGPQNQSIFYSFRVDQNPGKATAESIEVTNQMANLYGGRGASTQNVSLYNLYKSRNYTCTISMMGNAMIQPTMYFNLRYVPMFYGPYMIQTVDHTITPGNFETIIQGTKQPTASLPKVDEYLQTLRKSLLNSIINKGNPDKTPTQTQTTQTSSNNIIDEKNKSSNQLLDQPQKVVSPYNKCESNLFADYNRYENITPQESKSSYKNYIDIIRIIIPEGGDNDKLRVVIFALAYLMSNNSSELKSLENNFIGIGLTKRWGGELNGFFNKQYYCSNSGTPYVSFETITNNIRFLNSRWGKRMGQVQITKESISKFIILYLNPVTNTEENQKIYVNYDSNSLQNIETKVESAIKIYNSIT